MITHQYKATVKWTGNAGKGTASYRAYDRSYVISINDKPNILGSADPAFRGDWTKHNPEDLFLTSLSACHMLWYLHLCSEAGIIVTEYTDDARGTMEEVSNGGGRFTEVILNPVVKITDVAMKDKANDLHNKAKELCFIANSVNFPVLHNPRCLV